MLFKTLLILSLGSAGYSHATGKEGQKPASESIKNLVCESLTEEALEICKCVVQKGHELKDPVLRQEIVGLKVRLSQAQRHMTPQGQLWVRETSVACRAEWLRERNQAKESKKPDSKPIPKLAPIRNLNPSDRANNQSESSPAVTGTPIERGQVQTRPTLEHGQPIPVRVTPSPRDSSQPAERKPREKRSEPKSEKEEYEMLIDPELSE